MAHAGTTLVIQNRQRRVAVSPHWQPLLQRLTQEVLTAEGLATPVEVGLIWVDDEEIRQLNHRYRGKDQPTDVLSFPQWEPEELAALRPGHDHNGGGQTPPGQRSQPTAAKAAARQWRPSAGPGTAGATASAPASTPGCPWPVPDGVLPLGDVVISLERAVAQARDFGHSLEREMAYLYVHGLLHLLGYDHPDDRSERVMHEKAEAALAACGLSRS